ncbi:hypothetical protein BJX61DRAFT_533953 [Aspergillus egyptiacus]|nr:hypothetical protein BJX61DRAFT_533953 [Aspergillus egyptiacus]
MPTSYADDYTDRAFTPPPSSRSCSRMRTRSQAPQDSLKQFWQQFHTRFPGKVYTILPDNPYARSKAARNPRGSITGQDAGKSYTQARDECIRAVDRIAKECRRLNQKYSDPHFDIEMDLKNGRRNCLDGLKEQNLAMRPKGVKRVTEIFEKPQFYVNGPTASDVRQGRDGDCWFMAALCTMGNKEGLIDKICVRRDEQVGVYGFVFYRDSDWQQCIVDDKLYLRAADYDESVDERPIWDDINRKDTEEEYRKVWQTGSRALYFAQCADENETWLPLLEKAYAKAHGDYSAIENGFVGEAIEDMTGGVTSDVLTSNILDKDRFWKEELMQVNKEFLFGCGTGLHSNWLSPSYSGPPRDRKGITEEHAYSIMDAKEIDGVRLLKLRNPWGRKEWNGPWSDGSEQWTPQWMEKLNHKFGNDGVFWISYEDLLKKYQHLDRTRLFGPEWTVTQQWTSLNIPWSADYHRTKFKLNVTKSGPVVLVLSQLDTRYFKGLAGEYEFTLKFRLQKEGEDDYIVRSLNNCLISRSTNAEVDLEPGSYYILMKITAYRTGGASTEDTVIGLAPTRREKLVQIGLSYDLAHAKGIFVEPDSERQERELSRKNAERKRLRDETEKRLKREWIRQQKLMARKIREEERLAARAAKLSFNGNHPAVEGERVLADDDPVESPSDMDYHENGMAESKHLKSGSVPSIKFDSVHCHENHSSHDSGSSGSRRHRSTNSLQSIHLARRYRRHSRTRESELLDGFEFDSDIDMPPDEPVVPAPSSQEPFSDDLDNKTDPWNADEKLSLEVVRPIPENETEAALDMDDPAASATSEKGSRLLAMLVIQPQNAHSGAGNVIIRLPPGPLFHKNPAGAVSESAIPRNAEDSLSTGAAGGASAPGILADMTSSTVVTINYRLGPVSEEKPPCHLQGTDPAGVPETTHYRFPTPVHDTLIGFDWVLQYLQPTRLGVIGTHIGGSLALMLALTEPRSVHAVAAIEPVCDWTSLDEYCTSSAMPSPSRKRRHAPADLVPLLDARRQFFAAAENYFDPFASPILFLRSAGKYVPKVFPKYLTGPEYPVPVLDSEISEDPLEVLDAYPYDLVDDVSEGDQDPEDDTPVRRRKALSRWPPFGLDYGTSGPPRRYSHDPVEKLEVTLPRVHIFTPQGSEENRDASSASLDPHGGSETENHPRKSSSTRRRRGRNETVLARQAAEMASAMCRACFWGRQMELAGERVTLSSVPGPSGSELDSPDGLGRVGDGITWSAAKWLGEMLVSDPEAEESHRSK